VQFEGAFDMVSGTPEQAIDRGEETALT